MSEKELQIIRECLTGKKRAWDALVNQYTHFIYHVLRGACASVGASLSGEDLEDLHNDVFLRLLEDNCRRMKQFKGTTAVSFRAWLKVIAANVALGHLRRTRRTYSLSVEEDLPPEAPEPRDEGPSALESLEEREMEGVVVRLFDSLTPRERIFLDLAYTRNLPISEISGLMKMKPGALYTMKSRMVDKLERMAREEAG